jgi:ribonuclease-3 family protein
MLILLDNIKHERKKGMLTEREILSKTEAMQLNPVALAFVGDTVYSLYVRERLALSGCGKVAQLQKVAAQVVSAKGQSVFLDKLIPLFNEEEADIFRRGKNAKKGTKSKSATSLEYNRSTGLEAVLGFLYLTGQEARIKELLAVSDVEAFTIQQQTTPFKPGRF